MRSRWLFKNSDQNFRISWIFETKVKVVNFLFWVFKNKISIVNFLFSWQMTMGQWPTMRFVPSWRSNKIFLKKWKIGVDLKWWDILKPLFDKFALLTGLTSLMLRLMCSLVCPTSMATGQSQQMWVNSCYKSILQFASFYQSFIINRSLYNSKYKMNSGK